MTLTKLYFSDLDVFNIRNSTYLYKNKIYNIKYIVHKLEKILIKDTSRYSQILLKLRRCSHLYLVNERKQKLVQRTGMSQLNHHSPDFVPNIYFNYISVPLDPKVKRSIYCQIGLTNLFNYILA